MGLLFGGRSSKNEGYLNNVRSRNKRKRTKNRAAGERAAPSSVKRFRHPADEGMVKTRTPVSLDQPSQDLALVPEPAERPRRLPVKRFASIVTLSVVFVVCLFILIGLEIKHNALGREVSRLTSQKTALLEENRHLKAEMSRLTVFEDLEFVARQSLGLVAPDNGQIIVIP
jgi:cell division protein FtsL